MENSSIFRPGGKVGLLAAGIDDVHALLASAPQSHNHLVAIEKEARAWRGRVVFDGLFRRLRRFEGLYFNGGVGGDGEAAEGGERRIAEDSLDPVVRFREEVVRVFKDKGGHIAEGDASANGEAGNNRDADLDGTAGEGADGGKLIGDFEAGLFGQGAGDEVEGGGGVEHPTVRAGIDVDGKVGEAKRVAADLEQEGIVGLNGHGRVGGGQRQQLERHFDFVLLVGAQMALEAGFEGLIGLGGLGQIAGAEIVLGEGFAEEFFLGCITACGDLIDEGLEELD
jgi:hypothetical protein